MAQEVFHDPFCPTIRDHIVQEEERFWTVGRVERLAFLVVVHTIRDEKDEEVIRILSARKATPRERKFYEEVDE